MVIGQSLLRDVNVRQVCLFSFDAAVSVPLYTVWLYLGVVDDL